MLNLANILSLLCFLFICALYLHLQHKTDVFYEKSLNLNTSILNTEIQKNQNLWGKCSKNA